MKYALSDILYERLINKRNNNFRVVFLSIFFHNGKEGDVSREKTEE